METHPKVLLCIVVLLTAQNGVAAQILRTEPKTSKNERVLLPSFLPERKTFPLNDSLNRGLENSFENDPSRSPWLKRSSNGSIKRNENTRNHWPPAKKEVLNKGRKKFLDPLEDLLSLESKWHELSDRKYEHEGIIFPIHLPSHHHEKEDHLLIPLLLLILIPLLLFAIIIPLNANLLSTLFLIMQNNGAATTAAAAQLASGRRRRKRFLPLETHPVVEERIVQLLFGIHKIMDISEDIFN